MCFRFCLVSGELKFNSDNWLAKFSSEEKAILVLMVKATKYEEEQEQWTSGSSASLLVSASFT